MKGEPILVMLVEDNPDHAELVKRTLAEHRVVNRIHHVQDGQVALDYLNRHGEYADPERSPRPHVVLLDLRLPGLDGLEVLKAIKQSKALRRIPVVILTTSEAERDVARAYAHHANSYLVKPVGFDQFSKMMEDLGFYWLGWNTYPEP
jgi:CheY-like chemotaxis protein